MSKVLEKIRKQLSENPNRMPKSLQILQIRNLPLSLSIYFVLDDKCSEIERRSVTRILESAYYQDFIQF